MEKIRDYLRINGESKMVDIANEIGLSTARARAIIVQMNDVISVGENKNRRYFLSMKKEK